MLVSRISVIPLDERYQRCKKLNIKPLFDHSSFKDVNEFKRNEKTSKDYVLLRSSNKLKTEPASDHRKKAKTNLTVVVIFH